MSHIANIPYNNLLINKNVYLLFKKRYWHGKSLSGMPKEDSDSDLSLQNN